MMTGYRALIGCILTNLLLMIMLSSVALADSKVYQNSETGYVVRIVDDANLLSYEEEEKLVEDMKPVTKHGNAAFVSVYNYDSSTRTYAENHADGLIGSNGTLFLIDMGRREIYIYSQGAVWGKVTNSKARSITDNVYRHASAGSYYSCASAAFRQITAVLEGRLIAEPMKLISGILLSLLIGLVINFQIVRSTRKQNKPVKSSDLAAIGAAAGAGIITASAIEVYERIYSSSSDGGSDGSSGGGGGGGGGHSF